MSSATTSRSSGRSAGRSPGRPTSAESAGTGSGAVLEDADGSPRLVFRRLVPHATELVWQALTEADLMRAWFPQDVEYLTWDGQPATAVGVRFSRPGGGRSFDGDVLLCAPPAEFVLRWGPDVLRFELEPYVDVDARVVGTRLSLVVTLDGVVKAARDAGGWHVSLDALERALDDAVGVRGSDGPLDRLEQPWPPAERRRRWALLSRRYADRFPPEASEVPGPCAD